MKKFFKNSGDDPGIVVIGNIVNLLAVPLIAGLLTAAWYVENPFRVVFTVLLVLYYVLKLSKIKKHVRAYFLP